ncbi:MAG: ferredoxin [Saprospiraceae bacterium]|nr:ferredoxin [Saprospiraceae bacterium]
MIQITQQRAKCIGCNACVEAAAYRWRISRKDGKCTLIGAKEKRGFYTVTVHEHELEDNLLAARNCPVNIIKVLISK